MNRETEDKVDIETRLAQEIWAKTCYITDTEGLQHEVIHYGDLKDVIKALPPIKCEEQEKVGRWTYHSNSSFGINPEDAYCSRCGFHVCVVDVEFDDYKHCPKCGVKMEESND